MDIIQVFMSLFSDYGTKLAHATLVSVELLVVSSFFGFIIAIPLSIGRTSQNKIVYSICTVYSSIFRGTPLLVQLFVIYYGLGQFEALRQSFLWTFFRNAYFCAALALTLNVGSYMCEHVRAGILSIPEGEKEAALAVGSGKISLLIGIVIPRALRVATPTLTNEIIVQLKSTALASTITILDLTGYARRLSAQSYTLDPLIYAGAIYACLTLTITTVSRVLERSGNRYLSSRVHKA